MSYNEIEYKYRADSISVKTFRALCQELVPLSGMPQYGGSDTFYKHLSDSSSFCRHRTSSELNQLTYKQKTTDGNSIVRREVNVDLDPSTSADTIRVFLNANGYAQGNTIHKTSTVYIYEDFIAAYYICYDEEMKELGRFIEIEIREDKDLGDVKAKLGLLNIIERQLRPIGLGPKNRVSESLFEMYG